MQDPRHRRCIARLMALAIWFDELIRTGEVKSIGGVSRARVTQIMDLLNLAPEIQYNILVPPDGPMAQKDLTDTSAPAALGWARFPTRPSQGR